MKRSSVILSVQRILMRDLKGVVSVKVAHSIVEHVTQEDVEHVGMDRD
jgi:hypothetical protein